MKHYQLRDFQAWKVCLFFAFTTFIAMLVLCLDSIGMGQSGDDPGELARAISLVIMEYAGALAVMLVSVYAAKLFLRITGGIRLTFGEVSLPDDI